MLKTLLVTMMTLSAQTNGLIATKIVTRTTVARNVLEILDVHATKD